MQLQSKSTVEYRFRCRVARCDRDLPSTVRSISDGSGRSSSGSRLKVVIPAAAPVAVVVVVVTFMQHDAVSSQMHQ